jgi:tetratricopeptide (TPR) repeat protein
MWIDVLRDWLGLQEWESQEQELARLQFKCQELWGDEYEGYYPYLAKFLSLPLDKSFSSWVEHLEAEGLHQQFFLAVKSWVEAVAKREPLVIIFAEAHWADDASLEMLKHCLPLSDTEQVLWMVVFRPDPSAPTWAFNHYVETEYPHRITAVELSGLSESDSCELLERLIGAEVLPDEMRANILGKAEGNPYYLTEIVRSLVDREVLVRDPESGAWRVTQPDAPLDMPDTLIGLLTARITRLSPVEQRVLQMAAVIGTVFWFELLTALIGKDVPIAEHLTALQRSRLIRQRGSSSELGTEYVFISNLVRDAAYESVLGSRRAQYHLTVAEYLERLVREEPSGIYRPQYHGLIAYNYRQAKKRKKELAHTLLAADNAQRIYANAEAIRQYTRALELVNELEGSDDPPAAGAIDEWRVEALTGLGQNYFGVGEVSQAEKHLQEAVALGRRMDIGPKALARLFYWLGEVLFWQGRYEAPIHLGEEGLYLLGEDNKNLEAALMNQLVAVGCSQLGDHEKFIEFTKRTAGFIQDLPYTEELRPAYDHIIGLYAYTLKDVSQAEQWLAVFKQKAESYHDLRALGEVYNHHASIANRQGDLNSAIGSFSKAIEHFTRIGDDKHTCRALRSLGASYLQAGDLEKAEGAILDSLEKARILENKTDYALGYWFKAQILLCQGFREDAAEAFTKAQELAINIPAIQGGWAFMGLGQVHFALGTAQEITGVVQSTLENDPNLVYRFPYQAANILSRLERAFDNPAEFCAYVERIRQAHPELSGAPFSQWHLVPGEVDPAETEPICRDDFQDTLAEFWKWVDSFGDCCYRVDGALTIQAANERNLYHINRSAPRLVCREPLDEDFSIQATCQAPAGDVPAIGGLLLWQDEVNWFCLEAGARGRGELLFRGFKDNQDLVFGRGILDSTTVHLRVERRGERISAFCSLDGESWHFAGSTVLSSDAPVYAGLHANGHINRMIYPGAYPEGTAIRFRDFRLWGG